MQGLKKNQNPSRSIHDWYILYIIIAMLRAVLFNNLSSSVSIENKGINEFLGLCEILDIKSRDWGDKFI